MLHRELQLIVKAVKIGGKPASVGVNVVPPGSEASSPGSGRFATLADAADRFRLTAMTPTRLFPALVLLIVALSAAVPAVARDPLPPVISAPVARALQLAGQLVLVDIRSPEEWKRTGIAEGAVTVTVHRRDFVAALLRAIGGDRTRIIAVICATGGRSAMVRRSLERMGFPAIVDVSEGMLGNARGPGWIRRGLPVVAYRNVSH